MSRLALRPGDGGEGGDGGEASSAGAASAAEAEGAREVARYLLEERGLEPEVLRKYRVGSAQFKFRDPDKANGWRSYACPSARK